MDVGGFMRLEEKKEEEGRTVYCWNCYLVRHRCSRGEPGGFTGILIRLQVVSPFADVAFSPTPPCSALAAPGAYFGLLQDDAVRHCILSRSLPQHLMDVGVLGREDITWRVAVRRSRCCRSLVFLYLIYPWTSVVAGMPYMPLVENMAVRRKKQACSDRLWCHMISYLPYHLSPPVRCMQIDLVVSMVFFTVWLRQNFGGLGCGFGRAVFAGRIQRAFGSTLYTTDATNVNA